MNEFGGARNNGRLARQFYISFSVAIISIFLVISIGCEKQLPEPELVVRPVKLMTIGTGLSAAGLEYPGKLTAKLTANLGFEVPGKIKILPPKAGRQVEKGAILGELDPRDFSARLDSAKAELVRAQSDYNRHKELLKDGYIAQSVVDTKERTFKVAEAKLREERKALGDTKLEAPFAGIVSKVLVNDYANVRAKEPVLVLQDLSALEVVINIPERDMARGTGVPTVERANSRLTPVVILYSRPDKEIAAKFVEIATAAVPTLSPSNSCQ